MREALLAWYDAHKRPLPWRETRDPYAIWVSEVMLQQTRVETVIPYYRRFVERFPDTRSLAAASEDEVLASFGGLGYYRRARLLHAGVREVVERHGGEVPEDPAARLALPGVGRYTSGAIGSIAFGREEPVVDGNVARVLSRLYAVEDAIGTAESGRALWSRASDLVRGERPGELNQALMELGALVCVPARPRCASCPVSHACRARAAGRERELPHLRARAEPRQVALVAVVATRGDRVALVRTTGGLFAGLFGVPTVEGRGRDAALRALREAGVRARIVRAGGRLEHVLTHRILRVEVWRAVGATALEGEDRRMVALADLGSIGTSALTRRILAAR